MVSRIFKTHRILCGILPFFNTFDSVQESKTTQSSNLSEIKETGMERIQRIYKSDEFGNVSPELNIIINAGCMSMFTGALYGGIVNSRESYIDFMKNNQATVFRDHLEAKKRLQDKVTLSFGKGAFKWGWRLTLFTTSYITISTTIAAYRGDNGILEHVLAGGFTGLLYKFKMGPQASMVGAGLGVALGTIAGLGTKALLTLTGMNMQEIRYWQYKWRESKIDLKNEAIEKYMENEQTTIIMKEHDKLYGNNKGESLNDLQKNR